MAKQISHQLAKIFRPVTIYLKHPRNIRQFNLELFQLNLDKCESFMTSKYDPQLSFASAVSSKTPHISFPMKQCAVIDSNGAFPASYAYILYDFMGQKYSSDSGFDMLAGAPFIVEHETEDKYWYDVVKKNDTQIFSNTLLKRCYMEGKYHNSEIHLSSYSDIPVRYGGGFFSTSHEVSPYVTRLVSNSKRYKTMQLSLRAMGRDGFGVNSILGWHELGKLLGVIDSKSVNKFVMTNASANPYQESREIYDTRSSTLPDLLVFNMMLRDQGCITQMNYVETEHV